jgi:pimeloyl-ACP methyl ester carboxylesterase
MHPGLQPLRTDRKQVKQAEVEGITLEYDLSGSGEPVVFIHGAFIADPFKLLKTEPRLATYRLITYSRRGYAGSSHPARSLSLAEHAADCRALLGHLGVESARVVGHSFGGCIALQLALDAPEAVHSLALLEPALMVGASAEGYRDALAASSRRYHEAGAATAVDEGIQARWPEYREHLPALLPGAFEQAVADAATTYELDTPGMLDWHFGEAEARRLAQPVLSVLGEKSEALWPRFGETHRALLAWLPQAEPYVLPRSHHFLELENPGDLAAGLAAFFARHPMTMP